MTAAAPPQALPVPRSPAAVVQAPAHWRHVDFIADLHLQANQSATFAAWQDYMQNTRANAVFILGDLFEVWVGDDVLDGAASSPVVTAFETHCAKIIGDASRRLAIFFMHGNRDFLLGAAFAKRCGVTLLDDPTVLAFAGQRWLLSHGDALCLDDTDYMAFRAQVRTPQWRQDFLAQPLARRLEIAHALRAQSELRKRNAVTCVDLDQQASCDWLHSAHASTLIHGHTHKPATHELPGGLRRIVLSDWDAAATPARAEILRLSATQPAIGPSCTEQRVNLIKI